MIDTNYWYHLSNGFAGNQSVLTRTGTQLVMSPLDSRGRNPNQLWRFVPLPNFDDGWYRIHNQALVTDFSLDCSQTAPVIGTTGQFTGQEWHITSTSADPQLTGPEWYHFSNLYIGPEKRLDSSKTAPVVGGTRNSLGQYWRLTAMDTVIALPKPTSEADQFYWKYATTTQGAIILGTGTATDWAVLRAQALAENLIQSLKNPADRTKFKGYRIIVVGDNEVLPPTSKLPYPYLGASFNWDCYRGGTTGTFLAVTEEMMCRVGVTRRSKITCPDNPDDKKYREYDQIAHELGHAVNFLLGLNSQAVFKGYPNPGEQFAWSVEKWFKTSFYSDPNKSQDRESLKEMKLSNQLYGTAYDYLASIFDPNTFYYPTPLYHMLYVPGKV